jgi:hypothetical protein
VSGRLAFNFPRRKEWTSAPIGASLSPCRDQGQLAGEAETCLAAGRGCPCRKSNPNIVKSAENWMRTNAPSGLNSPRERRILCSGINVSSRHCSGAYRKRAHGRCRSPKTTTWSRHSLRIEPTSRSVWPFCHGDRGAVGRSRIPIARSRRGFDTLSCFTCQAY